MIGNRPFSFFQNSIKNSLVVGVGFSIFFRLLFIVMIIDYDYDSLDRKREKTNVFILCNFCYLLSFFFRFTFFGTVVRNCVITDRAFDSCMLMELGHRWGHEPLREIVLWSLEKKLCIVVIIIETYDDAKGARKGMTATGFRKNEMNIFLFLGLQIFNLPLICQREIDREERIGDLSLAFGSLDHPQRSIYIDLMLLSLSRDSWLSIKWRKMRQRLRNKWRRWVSFDFHSNERERERELKE